MEKIQNQHQLECLRKIEKALDNAEKRYNMSQAGLYPDQALTQVKTDLNKAWEFYLKPRS
ncbi:hypothetical protein [Alteribacillus iranensis]|uniref:hypothetical protein n=1 Tax=Alteribacillus iranensis TaxID=930128 RepID=UPI000B820AC0|nr:hypothetical protein [Alteribacillus iranensis]